MFTPDRQLVTERGQQKQGPLQIVASCAVTSVVLVLGDVYQIVHSMAWQTLGFTALSLILLAASLFSLRLMRRGQVNRGGLILSFTMFLLALAIPILAAGVGLLVALVLFILTLFLAMQVATPGQLSWLVVLSILVGLAAVLIDLYQPPTQLASEVSSRFITAVAIVLVAAAIFLVVRQFKQYPLSTKLIIVALSLALIPLIFVGVVSSRSTRAALEAGANQALFAAASETAASLDAFLGANLDAIRIEAQLPQFGEYLSLPAEERPGSPEEADVAQILRALGRKNAIDISSYALLDLQGMVLVDTFASDIGRDESGNSYFLTPLQTSLPYVSPVELSPTTGNSSLYFSSPVRDARGQIVGLLRARYEASALQRIVSQKSGLLGEGSFAILLDENHIFLAHGDEPELVLKTVAPLPAARLAVLQGERRLPLGAAADLSANLLDFEQDLARSGPQLFFATHIYAGAGLPAEEADRDQVAVTTMQTQPWWVAFVQPRAAFLTAITVQTQTAMLVALGTAGIVAILAGALAQFLSRPIVQMTAAARRVADGHLDVYVPIRADDEIGALALAFNMMAAQLRDLIGSLEHQVEERTEDLRLINMELMESYQALRENQAKLLTAEKMASLGRLTAGIAHEMNTPLAAVRASLSELDKLTVEYQESIGDLEVEPGDHQEIAREMRQAIRLADSAAERAAGFVRSIKTQTRDRSSEERRHFDAVPVTQEALLLLHHALQQGDCSVEFEPGEPHIELYGSPGRFAQVVTNLVSNAIDASAANGGAITVRLRRNPEGVSLEVSDDGVGIVPENMSRIFEPMFTTKPFGQGTGLGLTIVHDIVTGEFGGTIEVSSQPGLGAVFQLQFPDRNNPDGL
ncbi:MAG: ATP-binding protein [Chloroflexi bacterium]|nr:ATP-binding protein [Chloroflexota bacterium]MCI0728638.1 ATP-binding protein [Chloroflexota bacterium]